MEVEGKEEEEEEEKKGEEEEEFRKRQGVWEEKGNEKARFLFILLSK